MSLTCDVNRQTFTRDIIWATKPSDNPLGDTLRSTAWAIQFRLEYYTSTVDEWLWFCDFKYRIARPNQNRRVTCFGDCWVLSIGPSGLRRCLRFPLLVYTSVIGWYLRMERH